MGLSSTMGSVSECQSAKKATPPQDLKRVGAAPLWAACAPELAAGRWSAVAAAAVAAAAAAACGWSLSWSPGLGETAGRCGAGRPCRDWRCYG